MPMDSANWLWRLEEIQRELEHADDKVKVAFSVQIGQTLQPIVGEGPFVIGSKSFSGGSNQFESFPLGLALCAKRDLLRQYVDLGGGIWIDFECDECPRYVCWDDLSIHPSLSQLVQDREALQYGTVEWTTWHFVSDKDSVAQCPERDQDKLRVLQRSDRLMELYGAIAEIWFDAPQVLLDRFGNLCGTTYWPTSLLLLALQRVHPCLNVRCDLVRSDRIIWEELGNGIRVGASAPKNRESPREFYDSCDYLVSLSPDSVTRATTLVFEAFRQIIRSSNSENQTTNKANSPLAAKPDQTQGTYGIDPPPEPPLCERAQLVLTVLRNEGACSSDHRLRTSDIAVKAAGKEADPNQYKEVVSDLKQLGYVDTKEGRGGGCWLTTPGLQRADKL